MKNPNQKELEDLRIFFTTTRQYIGALRAEGVLDQCCEDGFIKPITDAIDKIQDDYYNKTI